MPHDWNDTPRDGCGKRIALLLAIVVLGGFLSYRRISKSRRKADK